ncbi:hypothetical protein RHS04_09703 [Rhizoctonia solani]|uniref:Uncharacterized protein n=1 Tax=Rhizoctonia solani TaxID=456999 RepID=A0A8H7LI06_9AGAM|nr:hypothetical protein RHS04_09703 [Rhizoctonia solani]
MPRAAKTKEEEWRKYLRRLNRWILWWQGMIPEAAAPNVPPTPPLQSPLAVQEPSLFPDDSASQVPAPSPLLQPSWHNQIVDTGPNNKPVLPAAPPAAPPAVPAAAPAPPPQPTREGSVVDISSDTTVINITETIIDLTDTTVLEFSNDEPAPIEPAGGPAGLDSSGGTGVVLENRAETVIPETVPPSSR